MKLLNPKRIQRIRNILNVFGVIASILLVVSISMETFSDDPFMAHTVYF